MEHISRAAFLQHVRHVLESGEQEAVELFGLDAVVLDGQAGGTFEGHPVGRVGHDQVGALAVHELLYIFRLGGVPAHKAVPADRPDVARLHKRGFLQSGGQVEIIIFRLVAVPGVERGQFLLVKSCQ